jgi:hypothetical protein
MNILKFQPIFNLLDTIERARKTTIVGSRVKDARSLL